MTVINKQQKYKCIKIDLTDKLFFVTLGSYFGEHCLDVTQVDDMFTGKKEILLLSIDNKSLELKNGDYLLINEELNTLKYIDANMFNDNFIIINEGE